MFIYLQIYIMRCLFVCVTAHVLKKLKQDNISLVLSLCVCTVSYSLLKDATSATEIMYLLIATMFSFLETVR
jgi:hypothetical protein